jgi:hypothetical protein
VQWCNESWLWDLSTLYTSELFVTSIEQATGRDIWTIDAAAANEIDVTDLSIIDYELNPNIVYKLLTRFTANMKVAFRSEGLPFTPGNVRAFEQEYVDVFRSAVGLIRTAFKSHPAQAYHLGADPIAEAIRHYHATPPAVVSTVSTGHTGQAVPTGPIGHATSGGKTLRFVPHVAACIRDATQFIIEHVPVLDYRFLAGWAEYLEIPWLQVRRCLCMCVCRHTTDTTQRTSLCLLACYMETWDYRPVALSATVAKPSAPETTSTTSATSSTSSTSVVQADLTPAEMNDQLFTLRGRVYRQLLGIDPERDELSEAQRSQIQELIEQNHVLAKNSSNTLYVE